MKPTAQRSRRAGGDPKATPAIKGNLVTMAGCVKAPTELKLFFVVQAPDGGSCGFRTGKSRKKKTRQDGDDGDHVLNGPRS
jgi:hypothetical protein